MIMMANRNSYGIGGIRAMSLGDLLVNMARQSYERSMAIDAKQRGISQKIEQIKPVLEITQGKP